MEIIEKLKNCEGCKRRRNFLKQMFGGIIGGIGLSFLLPSKVKAQLNCEFTHCTNGDIALCCDPFCDHCSISSRERCCIHVLEFCEGVPTYTATCCVNGTCPGISQTQKDEPALIAKWKIILDNSTYFTLLSSNENLDPITWLEKHNAKFTDKNGKSAKVVTANKVSA